MKKLQLGKISSKELADWFGLSYSRFNHIRAKKLEELKEYCYFTAYHGGVEIKTIYMNEYINPKQSNYKVVELHTDECWDESGLDTKKNVAEKIYTKYKDELDIQPSTTYNYVQKASNVLYGPANDYDQSGTIGNCWYKLCILSVDGKRRPLTEEEQKRRAEIRKKYCSDEEKEKREEIEDSVELKYKNGLITKEEKNEIREQLNAWRLQYLLEFESTLEPGEILTYATFKHTF